MISYIQAFLLGAFQGISELFPISSLGHSVIIPRLFGWTLDQNDPYFLTFLVATHAATSSVLFFFFWSDWKRIVAGLGRSIVARTIAPGDTSARLGWLLLVGTIPAGLLGLLFEHPLRAILRKKFQPVLLFKRQGHPMNTLVPFPGLKRWRLGLRRF